MAPFIQNPGTGVRELDAGNEGLCYLLERLFEPGVECRRGPSGAGVCAYQNCTRIEAIIRYVRGNFAKHELVMAASSYPGHDAHRADHSALVAELTAMRCGGVCADRNGDAVRDFVARWALEHFQQWDRPFGKWAVTRRVLEPTR
jgi:hypothetical protein